MGRRNKFAPPALRHHKGKGLAYVFVDGRQIYLGKYGSREAATAYRDIVNQWHQQHGPVPSDFAVGEVKAVSDLVAAFMVHAGVYYRRADGSETEEVGAFRRALQPIFEQYADWPTDEFKPRHLYAIVEQWVREGFKRQTINKNIGRVKRVWSWGASRELVSGAAAGEIQLVERLQSGRTLAKDYRVIPPVPLRDIIKVIKYLGEPSNQRRRANSLEYVKAMILAIYYCGARPGEVCTMKGEQIFQGSIRIDDRTVPLHNGVWAFVPTQTKVSSKGKFVMYLIGPRLQRVLTPLIEQAAGLGYLFPTRRREFGTVFSFNDTIEDACKAAGVERWTPNQLRHTFLTRMDRIAGLQMASSLVSHASLATTAGYVEKNLPGMSDLISRIG